MSAAAQTRVFGFNLKLNPKLLVAGLVGTAGLLFWTQSSGGDHSTATVPRILSGAGPISTIQKSRVRAHRVPAAAQQNKLELRVIDVTRTDLDPALRLNLLSRLQSMPEPGKIRNVFETVKSAEPAPKFELQVPISAPSPVSLPPPIPIVVETPFTIDLKYCGFLKSPDLGKDRRGFFLDGEKVLIGSEGEVLNYRYRIVGLTTASAELEDIEVKKRQTLTLVAAKVNQ